MTTSAKIPRHIAIIMDGNGRWAENRNLPRFAGHKAGVEAARLVVEACIRRNIEVLTLFMFSSENWQRPMNEVSELMRLFLFVLQHEVKKLHKNNVQLIVIGDTSKFASEIQEWINTAQEMTRHNSGMKLVLAANYGGRWDITQALQAIINKVQLNQLDSQPITEALIAEHLVTANLPEPDLFIRTSGELRISNFLIWQLAYTEMFFTDIFWPDFNAEVLEAALEFFATRKRRFGGVPEII